MTSSAPYRGSNYSLSGLPESVLFHIIDFMWDEIGKVRQLNKSLLEFIDLLPETFYKKLVLFYWPYVGDDDVYLTHQTYKSTFLSKGEKLQVESQTYSIEVSSLVAFQTFHILCGPMVWTVRIHMQSEDNDLDGGDGQDGIRRSVNNGDKKISVYLGNDWFYPVRVRCGFVDQRNRDYFSSREHVLIHELSNVLWGWPKFTNSTVLLKHYIPPQTTMNFIRDDDENEPHPITMGRTLLPPDRPSLENILSRIVGRRNMIRREREEELNETQRQNNEEVEDNESHNDRPDNALRNLLPPPPPSPPVTDFNSLIDSENEDEDDRDLLRRINDHYNEFKDSREMQTKTSSSGGFPTLEENDDTPVFVRDGKLVFRIVVQWWLYDVLVHLNLISDPSTSENDSNNESSGINSSNEEQEEETSGYSIHPDYPPNPMAQDYGKQISHFWNSRYEELGKILTRGGLDKKGDEKEENFLFPSSSLMKDLKDNTVSCDEKESLECSENRLVPPLNVVGKWVQTFPGLSLTSYLFLPLPHLSFLRSLVKHAISNTSTSSGDEYDEEDGENNGILTDEQMEKFILKIKTRVLRAFLRNHCSMKETVSYLQEQRHISYYCDGCGACDFRGKRKRCLSCSNYDLCEKCYVSGVETYAHSTTQHLEYKEYPSNCVVTSEFEKELFSI